MMESTSAIKSASTMAGRKTNTRQSSVQRASQKMQSSLGAPTQLPKVIKKSYVRFDDYLDLNEENMRRSCKRLMNRLYKEPKITDSQQDNKQTGLTTGVSDAIPDTAVAARVATTTPVSASIGGRSYLRSQFERRQQRQLAAMLKSAKARQVEVMGALSKEEKARLETETVKVSSGANKVHDPTNEAMSEANNALYQCPRMVQQQQEQHNRDSVARSHELSKRRFFEQLERRKSTVNATRDATLEANNIGSMQQDVGRAASESSLGHTNAAIEKDQKSAGNHQKSGQHRREAMIRAYNSDLLAQDCWPRNESANTQIQVVEVGSDCSNLIAWTHNLSATTNETQTKTANGSLENDDQEDNEAVAVASQVNSSADVTKSSLSNSGNRTVARYSHLRSRTDDQLHQAFSGTLQDSSTIDNYGCATAEHLRVLDEENSSGKQLGAQLITGTSKSQIICQSNEEAIGIDACNSNRLLLMPNLMVSRESKSTKSMYDDTSDCVDELGGARTMLFAEEHEQSMFEIKVPAAGECEAENSGLACDGYISELVVKQMAETDGFAVVDQVSGNRSSSSAVGIKEKGMISDDRGRVRFGLSWRVRPPTGATECQGYCRSEAPKDALKNHQPIGATSGGNKTKDSIVARKTPSSVAGLHRTDCINNSNDDDVAENNKCAVEISNHKFEAAVESSIINDAAAQETIASQIDEENDNNKRTDDDKPAHASMVAPTISSIESEKRNDNQRSEVKSGKKPCPYRVESGDIYDSQVNASARPMENLGSENQVHTGAGSLDRNADAARTSRSGSSGIDFDTGPETDVAITKEKQQLDSLHVGKINGPDKITAAATGKDQQVDSSSTCFGCKLDGPCKEDCCSRSSGAIETEMQAKNITHDSSLRDVPLLPEASPSESNKDGVGKINRLLVRNKPSDEPEVRSEQQQQQQHHQSSDYKQHDEESKVVTEQVGCKDGNQYGDETEVRAHVNERKANADAAEEPEESDCGGADANANAATEKQLQVQVAHLQSQRAKEPDSSGKCFLNDANRLIRSFELAPADKTAAFAKQHSGDDSKNMNWITGSSGGISHDDEHEDKASGNKAQAKLEFAASIEPANKMLNKCGNAATTQRSATKGYNNNSNYNTKHSKKLCNDTCGGDVVALKCIEHAKNEQLNCAAAYGQTRVIELSAMDTPERMNLVDNADSEQQSGSNKTSVSSSPVASPPISVLRGIARGSTTINVATDEDGCCGSSSCSSSGFGASVASTDGSESAPQTAPTGDQASSTATSGGKNDTAPKSLPMVSLANGSSMTYAHLNVHNIDHRRRGLASLAGDLYSSPQHLMLAPHHNHTRTSEKLTCGGGGAGCDGGLPCGEGVCGSKRTSLLDEFPDYKQLSVRPDQAYPKRSERPPVVVENYGYASVLEQQHRTGTQVQQVNLNASGAAQFKEHSYANIPNAWNNMDNMEQQAAAGNNNHNHNNNGYAIVRNGIRRMSAGPLRRREFSSPLPPLPAPAQSTTSTSSSASSSSAESSSSQSAGFSALPPVRLLECTSANNFESLPPVHLNSNITQAPTICHSVGQQKTKGSLLKRFGSLVSRAFTANNGSQSDDATMSAASSTPVVPKAALPPTMSQSAVGTEQADKKENLAKEQQNDDVRDGDVKDADLVILPPKSSRTTAVETAAAQVGSKAAKALNERLSSSARARHQSRKPLRVGARPHRARHHRRATRDDGSASSSLCQSSESLCSSANAYHRRLKAHEITRLGSMDSSLLAEQNCTASSRYRSRQRASSLSEELESLMSRSTVDDESPMFKAGGGANRSDRKCNATKRSEQQATGKHQQVYGTNGAKQTTTSSLEQQKNIDVDNAAAYGVVDRRSHRFEIDCERPDSLGVANVAKKGTVDPQVVRRRSNNRNGASLQVLRWFSREPSEQCLQTASSKVESTPNLSKEASVVGGQAASTADDHQSGLRAADSKNENRRLLLRGSKVAVARNGSVAGATSATSDHGTKLINQHEPLSEFTSLIEQSHAANSTKLGRRTGAKQEQKLTATTTTTKVTTSATKQRRSRDRQLTSLIYSNLLHTAVKKSATGTTTTQSVSSEDESEDSMVDCDEVDEERRCKVCVASLNQDGDHGKNDVNDDDDDKCDSPSLYQILLRNYVKRRHTTTTASGLDKTDGCETRYCSLNASNLPGHRSRHQHRHHHHSHQHRHIHRHRHHHRSSSHHHHHHHHRRHHHHHRSDVHSFRVGAEQLDANELRIRGATNVQRTPTTSGAESCSADCYANRKSKSPASKGKRSSCCDTAAEDDNSSCSRQAHVWGQLIKINKSDGTQVVELQRASGKHWGFFVARGAINNVKGIFISRMHDTDSSCLVGLLSIGDRIMAIDDHPIEPDHDIMRVNQMISKKSKILLKVKPLKG